jgi:hypothetical protein
MIKCHGSQLDPCFYGQKGNSYPVALFSGTLKAKLTPQTLAAAMCCYGAQVYDPNDPAAQQPGEWPLAITYLRKGAWGFVGSTMIAWVGPRKMMCADWIVAGYLKSALGGASLGRAFLESKQDYVRWINQQGRAPDLADEKTLIEYVLLGDPSIQPVSHTPSTPAAKRAAFAAQIAGPSPPALEERRQRRVIREQMAVQIREMLPVRTEVKPARAGADKLFALVQDLLRDDGAAFGMQAGAARVHKLSTVFPVVRAAVRRKAVPARASAIKGRESFEYYWSGRRERQGRKEIRLVKVETDAQGNVLRSSVVHSC